MCNASKVASEVETRGCNGMCVNEESIPRKRLQATGAILFLSWSDADDAVVEAVRVVLYHCIDIHWASSLYLTLLLLASYAPLGQISASAFLNL